jgi:hypothetical protein
MAINIVLTVIYLPPTASEGQHISHHFAISGWLFYALLKHAPLPGGLAFFAKHFTRMDHLYRVNAASDLDS